jgi:hypothetical protein
VTCAGALHVSVPYHHPKLSVASRARLPAAKFISRDRVDFASITPKHEFGLQGNIMGLAPSANSGLLLVIAALVTKSQMLPTGDVAFAVAFPIYLMIANAMRFNGNQIEDKFEPLLRQGRGPWFKRYVATYAIFSLLLPVPFVFFGPSAVAAAAAPHLFLTLVQCAFESLTAHTRFAALLRLAVPIGFNTYRMGTIQAWCTSALATYRATAAVGTTSVWTTSALALALANGAIWTYNLVGTAESNLRSFSLRNLAHARCVRSC